ncbi:MFS transporter [Thermococcus barophilus]|nr:MFS transporter [Thermococcus barophilus]
MNRNLSLITLSNVILVSSNALWIMYIQYFLLDLGISKTQIGLIFTLALLMRAFGNIIGGKIADLLGYKRTLLVGYTIYAFPPLLFLLHNALLASLVYPLMSLGSGIGTPAKSLFIVEQTQRRKGLTYMLVQRVLPSIPPALTAPVGAKLYEMGKYDVAVFMGFFGLLISLLLLVFLKDTKRERAQDSFSFNLLRSKPFTIIVFLYSFDAFSTEAVQWIVPLYLRELGYSVLDYGFLISAQTLIIAFGGTFAGIFVDRFEPVNALGLSYLVVAMSLLAFSLGKGWILALAYLLWKTFGMIGFAALPLLIERYFSDIKASAFGTINAMTTLISIPAPSFGGVLLRFGVGVPFIFKATTNFVCFIWVKISLNES